MTNTIITRSRACLATLGVLALAGTSHATLSMYDATIAADNAGTLPYTAVLTDSVSPDGLSGVAFDFGTVTGSATVEFILSGDPDGGGRDGFLAVGANGTWNFRYEQWDDTAQIGFTHLGVADYLFTPAVASPTETTHVTFSYDATTSMMDLYLDGDFAASQSAPGYEMPTGAGFLGTKNDAGDESMLGTIDRVTVYDSKVDAATIKSHAAAWQAVPEPSTGLLATLGMAIVAFRRRR